MKFYVISIIIHIQIFTLSCYDFVYAEAMEAESNHFSGLLHLLKVGFIFLFQLQNNTSRQNVC